MSKFVLTAQLQLQPPKNVRQVVNQIQSQLQGVTANINVTGSAQAQRQIKKVADETDRASISAKNLGKALGLSIKRYAGFTIASRAVSLFTSTLADAVKESINFERELVKISQVTGKSVGQLKDLTDEITRLSTTFGVASSSLLNVSKILSQAGLNAVDTKIALDALAKSELAPTFDDITQTAEGVVAVFNQFGQGAKALEGQLGSINAVAGRFAVEAGDLISVVRRTGGVFKSSGGDLNELVALFTSVRSTTRESAESIATGLRTIFTRIQRPATIQYLRQFGVELLDLEGKFVGPFEATKRLSEALGGLEQGDIKFVEIAEELGGFRQIGKVIPLLQQFRVAQEALSVAQEGSGSLAEDAAKAQLTLAVRIQQVQQDFLALVRSITETTAFQVMASTVLSLAEALLKLGEALKPIIPLLGAVAGFRFAKGIGSFIGGTKKTLGFASGGLVPGSGNRDTVPAMLTPGEFVIRKSSVSKLGAGNLAAMNENRYATGGLVIKNLKSEEFAGLFARPKGADSSGKPITIAGDAISKGSESLNTEVLAVQGAPKSYFIGGTDEEAFTSKAESILTTGISEILSTIVGDPLAASDAAPNVIRSIGVSDIAGKIFEGVTKAAIQDFREGGERAGFDIPRFLEQSAQAGTSLPLLSNLFNNGATLPNIDYDNKLTESYNNRASLLKKAATAGYFGNNTNLVKFQDPISTDQLIKSKKSKELSPKAARRFEELEQARQVARQRISDTKVFELISKRISAQRRILRTKFATGGAVGTDTVPALLTPGEFVINRKSAESIGYGNLNRMNKVGKYAKGGVVHRFKDGTRSRGVPSDPEWSKKGLGGRDAGFEKFSNKLSNLSFALSIATASLSSFAPNIDENSSSLEKMTSSVLGSITTIGLLGSSFSGLTSVLPTSALQALTKGPLASLASGLAATAVTVSILDSAFVAMNDKTQELNKAIEEGKAAEAERLAGLQYDFEQQRSAGLGGGIAGGLGGAAAGAAIGTAIAPVIGTVIGAAIGGAIGSAGGYGAGVGLASGNAKERENVMRLAKAHAIAAEAAENLTKTQDQLSKALQEGNISEAQRLEQKAAKELEASQSALVEEYDQSLQRFKKLRQDVVELNRQADPNAPASDPFGLGAAKRTTDQAAAKIASQKLLEERKTLEESFKKLKESNQEYVKSQNKLLQEQARIAGASSDISSDDPNFGAKAFEEAMSNMSETFQKSFEYLPEDEQKEVEKQMLNLAKAAAEAKEKFDALNLSLTPVNSSAGAAIVGLDNLSNTLDPTGVSLDNSIRTLEASMTESAAGIRSDEFQTALDDVSAKLLEFGASDQTVNKFRGNTAAFAAAQKDFNSVFARAKADLESQEGGVRRSLDSGDFSDRIATAIDRQLKAQGFGQEERNRVVRSVRATELTDDQKLRVAQGDASVYQEILTQNAKEAFEEAAAAARQVAEAEKKLIPFIEKRIEAENRLIESQQKAIDILGEARGYEESFGGARVTLDERRNRVAARANVLGRAAGLSDVSSDTGSIENRTNEIRQAFSELQASIQGGQKVTPEIQAQQDRLKKAQEEQVNTIRELIKIQQEEIKTIQEKQRLEKESIDSLISGDIEKFFEQQAAQGAIAASATGNTSLMNAFGADATGAATKELQRLQAAGVNEVYGQQIGGAGGLLETTSLSAVQQRGLEGPAAMRAAQIAAGTTEEQLASERQGRELSQQLATAGDLGAEMSQMELNTAEIMVQKANIIIQDAISQTREAEQRGETTKANIEQLPRDAENAQTDFNDLRKKFADRHAQMEEEMRTAGDGSQALGYREMGMKDLELIDKQMTEAKQRIEEANRKIKEQEVPALPGGITGGPVQSQILPQQPSIDPSVVENLAAVSDQLNSFANMLSQSANTLQGTEIVHQLGDVQLNVNGLNFLKDLDPVVRDKVVDALQKELPKYRATSTGLANNNGKVLPTA